MPKSADYYFKTAEEVEQAAATMSDPALQEECKALVQALRRVGEGLQCRTKGRDEAESA